MAAIAFGDPAAFLCLVPGQSAAFGSFRQGSVGGAGGHWEGAHHIPGLQE